MKFCKCLSAVLAIALVCGVASSASAAVFFGPTPYLSTANIPAGFYSGGSPTFLDNLEDGTLDGGITASGGTSLPGFIVPDVDSVDADDGSIDGSGLLGTSWFVYGGAGAPSVTFSFTSLAVLPTAAALVWTDGLDPQSFEAFDANGVSLGTISSLALADGNFKGGTAEDRFLGVQHAGGISAIRITGGAGGGLEVDHIQYGQMVPEPGSIAIFLAFAGFGLFARWRCRRAG